MLIDDVEIVVKAGSGGEGIHTFQGFRKGVQVGANGGDGGRGGNVYFLGSNNVTDLSEFQFKKEIKAPSGAPGMPGNHNGKDAADINVLVPLGTRVTDQLSGRSFEIMNSTPILVVKGGQRGEGSYSLKGDKKARPDTDRKGEEKKLHLILNLIADIGVIGLPNAGKSSLLKKLTNANPKIGNYPFTTLEPNLGTIGKIILADIPGLIEGASLGKGLGTKFLKHIEKTKILIHCVSAEDPDPITSYRTVRKEFNEYNPKLLEKDELILLTKKDLVSEKELLKKQNLLKKENSKILTTSVFDEESLEELKRTLVSMV